MPKLENLDASTLAHNPRATLSAWMRYRSLVRAAMLDHPKTLSYIPANMAAATVASRLRDAIRGALVFEYPLDCTKEDLTKWYSEIVIRHTSTQVFIGPKENKLDALLEVQTQDLGSLEFASLTHEEYNAFALLLNNGRIQGPIVVRNGPSTMFTTLPNVEIIHRPDGSLVLL